MMSKIKFKIAAKTDMGLVRTNNEDNFQASSDLLVKPMRWVNNEVCQLGEKGALLVVADGMGGMNAGEVASQIAIDTVREEFSPERLSAEVTKNRLSIERFMNDVVVKADNRIKEVAKTRPETKGMGTTIVVAWLFKDILYVTWCGDSRAYVYNPKFGLHRLTKDHSYVQQLVDAGKLTDDEAFDFPESNIITRCLSDSKQKAQPESLSHPYKLCDNDVILLCTDGLCGMIRDKEIQPVIESNVADLGQMTDELVQAALNASGSDNVTVCLCQIISGGSKANSSFPSTYTNENMLSRLLHTQNLMRVGALCVICIIIGVVLSWLLFNRCSSKSSTDNKDSLKADTSTVINYSLSKDSDVENSIPEATDGQIPNDGTTTNALSSELKGVNVPRTNPGKVGSSDNSQGNADEELTRNVTEATSKAGHPSNSSQRKVIEVKVSDGQNAYGIARSHNMHRGDLEKLNPDIDLDHLHPGDKIKVYQ